MAKAVVAHRTERHEHNVSSDWGIRRRADPLSTAAAWRRHNEEQDALTPQVHCHNVQSLVAAAALSVGSPDDEGEIALE